MQTQVDNRTRPASAGIPDPDLSFSRKDHTRSFLAVQQYREKLGVRAPRAGDQISFPASKNPGGVYSDAVGGKQIGAYSLKIEDEIGS